MKKTICMVLVLSVVALSCQRSKNQLSSEGKAIPVRTVAVEEREVYREIFTSGIVKPKEEVRLSFKLGGEVEKIYFDESDWVDQGAVLAQLDGTEIRARVTQAKVGFDKAKRDLKRIRKLYEDKVSTLARFQDATSVVEKADADLAIAQYNLTHSEIRAPFSGRIAARFIEERELIPPGTPAFLLVDIHEVEVEVGITDSDIGNIQLGNEAEILVDAYPSEKFTGKVTRKAIAANKTSGTFQVKITVENRKEKLLPGMIAQVHLHTQPHQAIFVPIEALSSSDKEKGILFVLDETGRVHSQAIRIGSVRENQIEVIEGITPGAKIVAGGTAYLKDGDQVRLVN